MALNLPINDLECGKCETKFKPDVDVKKLLLFNQARKYNWALAICPKCGARHRAARFSKKDYRIYGVEE